MDNLCWHSRLHKSDKPLLRTRMLGAMYFTSHARTSHFEIFPRTHFARTCAFCLIFVRTRTRTSKVHIYNFLPFLPQIWIFFSQKKKQFWIFFLISEKLGTFFSEKKKKNQFWILFFKETWDSFPWLLQKFKCDRTCAISLKYPHTHALSHAQFQEASHLFRTQSTAHARAIAPSHAHTLTFCPILVSRLSDGAVHK